MSRALVVGLGGLGCPAALVLADAGVATIGLCDDDVVDVSNLHRQVLHDAQWAGRPKVESAAAVLLRRRPSLDLVMRPERLTAERALALVRGWDVVLDGTDSFAAKFLINDACLVAGVPFVHAGAVRWGGQLLAVRPGAGEPCYRCLFEAPPAESAGMSCREQGIAGPVAGVVGALQAARALALLDGTHRGGELLVYDGLAGTLRAVRFRRNIECVACGATGLATNYEELSCRS